MAVRERRGTQQAIEYLARTLTYNIILITCNAGMRPLEMRNLRWRDIMPAKNREGREIVV